MSDIFISYRRDGGDMTAMYIYQALKDRGYDVFYDVEVLRSGRFNEELLRHIQSCRDFIIVLSPHALDRCADPEDWVRKEIAEAVRENKNIVPIMMNGFSFPDKLPEDISSVRYHSGLSSSTEYFQESMNRLCEKFLTAKPRKKRLKWLLPTALAAAVCALTAAFFLWRPASPAPVPSAADAPVQAPAHVSAVPDAGETGAEERAVSAALVHTDFPVLSSAIETNDDSAEHEIQADGTPIEYEQKWPAMGNAAYTRDQIRSITFLPALENAPDSAWDVSEAGDGRILAWVEPSGELYDLFVAGDGGVKILDSPHASQLFTGYSSAVSISFNGCVDLSERESFACLFYGCHSLTDIDFSGVSTMSAGEMCDMFHGCWSLPALDLSFMDTSRVRYMGNMFRDCGSLRRLELGRFDTSMVFEMYAMFFNCGQLTELDVSGFDTSRVLYMDDMFFGCEALRRLDVSGFDTSRVENMHAMFYRCLSLEELDVSGWKTGNVGDFSALFSGCESLRKLDLRGFDTSRAEYLNSMFEGSYNLTELDVSGFDTSRATSTAWMFCQCRYLDTLDLSGWNTANVLDMSYMFNNCSSLYKLDLSGFDTGKTENMESMFACCGELREADLSTWDLSRVQTMREMFAGCESLESIGRDPAAFGRGDTTDMYAGCGRLPGAAASGA